MKKIDKILIFDTFPGWDALPEPEITQFFWEGENPYRPRTWFSLCGVQGEGLYLRMYSQESPLCCVCKDRDDPVWCDSCMEFFVQPIPEHAAYLNIEMNPNGVYLSQFGTTREDRVFLKEITQQTPTITPFSVHDGWGVTLFLPDTLIADVYQTQYHTCHGNLLRGNFYKCGDETPRPHYGAYYPVEDLALGFHNPGCFGWMRLEQQAAELA